MGSDEVTAKVSRALADVLGMDEGEIKPEAKLVGDLQATSLDVVDLLFQLKKSFGIQLTLAEVQGEISGGDGNGATQGFDDALFQNVTVEDLTGWVRRRLPA